MDNVYSGYFSNSFFESGGELSIEQVTDYYRLVLPVIPSCKGKVIITSTPSPDQNHFYRIFTSQENRDN